MGTSSSDVRLQNLHVYRGSARSQAVHAAERGPRGVRPRVCVCVRSGAQPKSGRLGDRLGCGPRAGGCRGGGSSQVFGHVAPRVQQWACFGGPASPPPAAPAPGLSVGGSSSRAPRPRWLSGFAGASEVSCVFAHSRPVVCPSLVAPGGLLLALSILA